MTLTGVTKHVRILEGAELVATEKVGCASAVPACVGWPTKRTGSTDTMLQDRLDRLDHSWSVRKPGHREAKGKPS